MVQNRILIFDPDKQISDPPFVPFVSLKDATSGRIFQMRCAQRLSGLAGWSESWEYSREYPKLSLTSEPELPMAQYGAIS